MTVGSLEIISQRPGDVTFANALATTSLDNSDSPAKTSTAANAVAALLD